MEFGESRPVLPSALQDLTTSDNFLSEIRRPSLAWHAESEQQR